MELTSYLPFDGMMAALRRLSEGSGNLRQKIHDAAARRREKARIIAELGAMRDRELTDMGIARCDIGRIAREAVGER